MALKIAIYTAIFGGKDIVRDPLGYEEDENIDYFLISDDENLKSNCYNIIYKEPIYDDITKNARYYKVMGLEVFKNYDFVIWHDANLQIIQDKVLNIITYAHNKEIAFFNHPDRNCIYDEAIKCIQLEKDYPFKILKQIFGYYIYGIKNESGLFETGIVVKNSKLISKEFLDVWWGEIKLKTRRDQLSLPFALKKLNIEPGIIDGCGGKNEFTFFSKHNHSKYNFLSLNEPKPFNRLTKKTAVKLIKLIKKMNV